MTEYLLDTWAWIEYFEGSEKGSKVDQLLRSEEKVYTSIISLSELSDNFHRKDVITGYSWEEIQEFVETKSDIISLNSSICAEAGRIKSRQRKEMPDFGIIDALILATARKNNLKIVSGDNHIQKQKESAKEI